MTQEKARTALHQRLLAIHESIDNIGSGPGPENDYEERIVNIENEIDILNSTQQKILKRLYAIHDIWIVRGIVVDGKGIPKQDAIISAWDRHELEYARELYAARFNDKADEIDIHAMARRTEFVGVDITDEMGRFQIIYQADDFEDFKAHLEEYTNLVFSIIQSVSGASGKLRYQTVELEKLAGRLEFLKIKTTIDGIKEIYDENGDELNFNKR